MTGNKGQVALFVALMFQVLFLFFAMIVNVGLVVHHKINLQNSVDMAAYYGAMKQAELLNSIGHINYQMRQSWKLLAWRYRILGTAGDTQRHPYDHIGRAIRPDKDFENSNDTAANFLQPPFCITYPPFNDSSGSTVPENESPCKEILSKAVERSVIRLFGVPAVVAGWNSLVVATSNITFSLRENAQERCKQIGPLNYITVGNFLLSYQMDQYARRKVIAKISRSMSQNIDDFDDLDGKSVKTGSEETFKRNLTYANKEGKDISFEMYNSLAHPGCGNVPADTPLNYPAPWLAEIRVFPLIFYMDLTCDGNQLHREVRTFELKDPNILTNTENRVSLPNSYFAGSATNLNSQIEYLAKSLYLYSDNNRFLLGFEKNPWCQAYVGTRASTKPKIPFAPSDLTLTAEAYAKPFGGRIGPWYYKKWAPADKESTGDLNSRTDINLPLRINDVSVLQGDPTLYGSPLRVANYSKYIGDQFGLRSWRTLGHFARAMFNLSPNPPYRTISSSASTADQKILSADPKSPLFDDWYEIAKPIESNTEKDILAWNKESNRDPGIRSLEIAGLAPDQFDLAYYSIDPNFYDNYYKKMQSGIIRKLGIDTFFRPDLGARIGHNTLERFSVKDQIKLVKDISQNVLDFQTKLTYTVKNPVHLLTSWSNKSVFEYDKPDSDYFGNCLAPMTSKQNYTDPQENTAFLKPGESVPGECISGGRTGYSVKIISKDFLFSPTKAGGLDGSTSLILNPPTDF